VSTSDLPALNAVLNGTSAVLLLAGWRQIRGRRVPPHRAFMIAAICVSAAFLASYLTYHSLHGSTRFLAQGPIRAVYMTVLATHTVLAAVVVPLVVVTFTFALRARFDRHRRWARVTFPIWLYVSVTGVLIYLMLYQWFPSQPG
jgi:uncharacterized membrane protein YozB (DUF420 family)